MPTFTNPHERIEHLMMRTEALEAALHRWLAAYGSTDAMSDETRDLLGIPSWREHAAPKSGRCPNMAHKRYALLDCTECGAT